MGRVLNLMAFVVFATTLFMRSVDPVIPQIAEGLNVTPTTAAMLSTGFTLPYALIQPVLGALADMFSKTRLIALCMLTVGIATLACGLATNFETLMASRVVAGMTAGGVFPIALAVAGDRVPVQQRQVAIGRLLFAAMSGNLLGASGAGVIGDLFGWRGVFFVTGAIDLVALAAAYPGFRSMGERPGRFDLSTLLPNYRAIFSNPMAKYCFGVVPLLASMKSTRVGERRRNGGGFWTQLGPKLCSDVFSPFLGPNLDPIRQKPHSRRLRSTCLRSCRIEAGQI